MAESGLPGVREDDARVMESGYVGRDDRGVAVLHAPGRNQDHAGKAELRTPARHEGRYRGAVGDAPMAMGADHQQAGAARGLQDRAADVLVVHDHGARLDAVGVSSGARGLDRARGARSDRAWPGRPCSRPGHPPPRRSVSVSPGATSCVACCTASCAQRQSLTAQTIRPKPNCAADGDVGTDPDGNR